MPDYLAVPPHRQERVVHEKARARRRGELHWIRTYRADLVDDDALFGEPATVRFLDLALLSWASGSDWLVPLDTRAIAGRFGWRGRDVAPALKRLLELGRFDLVTVDDTAAGGLQPALFATTTTRLSTGPGSAQDPSGSHAGSVQDPRDTLPGTRGPTATSALAAQPASPQLAQSRAEKRREVVGKTDAYLDAGLATNGRPALPDQQDPEILRRIIGLAARGDTRSAALIRREATGLPEALLARALESLLTRRPRPRNPGGYLLQTLRSIRAEHGYPQTERATLDREPDL